MEARATLRTHHPVRLRAGTRRSQMHRWAVRCPGRWIPLERSHAGMAATRVARVALPAIGLPARQVARPGGVGHTWHKVGTARVRGIGEELFFHPKPR